MKVLPQYIYSGSPAKLAEARSEAGLGSEFARKYPLRILIAEDNYINRKVLLLWLHQMGYTAQSTENGMECMNEALHGNYDLILTDIDMPEMNGIDCTYNIRQAGNHVPIIAITASSPYLTREQCLEVGMNGYMLKPISGDELRCVLREAFLSKFGNWGEKQVGESGPLTHRSEKR